MTGCQAPWIDDSPDPDPEGRCWMPVVPGTDYCDEDQPEE